MKIVRGIRNAVICYLALVLVSCVLMTYEDARKPCVKAALRGIALCMPEGNMRVSYWPDRNPMAFHINVPVKRLPIIPDDPGYGGVRIELQEEFESFASSQARAVDAFETTYREPTTENGMTVLTVPPKEITFWSHDVLLPTDGSKAYFICARTWVDREGKTREALCGVNVDWNPQLTRPRVRLQFHMRRKDLAQWKETEAIVRAFIKEYTVFHHETI
jgi:hypothetical protein